MKLDSMDKFSGELNTRDEFGYPNDDAAGISVLLEDGVKSFSYITGADGKFEFNDIPAGTYNFVVSKEGYGEYKYQGFQIIGGDGPIDLYFPIYKKSSATIDDFSANIFNDSLIYLDGIVKHGYVGDYADWLKYTSIQYYIHIVDSPSNTNYLENGYIYFNAPSGSQLAVFDFYDRPNSRIYLNKERFPSGSKIYIVAYFCPWQYVYYYDIFEGRNIYPNIGDPSDVVSITVP